MDQLIALFTWLTGLIDSVSQLVTDSPVTYLVILAMAAVDPIFPILPAEAAVKAAVTTAAVLAGLGRLSMVWIIAAAALGAFIGDNLAYWIGRAGGRPLVGRVLRGHTHQLRAIQEQFDERGGLFMDGRTHPRPDTSRTAGLVKSFVKG